MEETKLEKENTFKQLGIISVLVLLLWLMQRFLFVSSVIMGCMLLYLLIVFCLFKFSQRPKASSRIQAAFGRVKRPLFIMGRYVESPMGNNVAHAGLQLLTISLSSGILLIIVFGIAILQVSPVPQMIIMYIILVIYTLAITDRRIANLFDKGPIGIAGFNYDVNVTRRLIMLIYTACLVWSSINDIIVHCSDIPVDNPNLWRLVFAPSFLTYLSFERALR